MAADGMTRASDDADIVRGLELVYQQVEEAASAGQSPERAGLLNALRVMLEPTVRAARLLVDDDRQQQPG